MRGADMRARSKQDADSGHGGLIRRICTRAAPDAAVEPPAARGADDQMDWPRVLDRLRLVRHRWDLAILCHLDEDEARRSADLLTAVNSKAGHRKLSPQVLSVRLRALEGDGCVKHDDLARIPLHRVYYLLPPGRAMLRTLRSLEPWDEHMPDRRSGASTGHR
jgi:DNA-binding HxlR family transcriptional regulator